MPPLRQIRLRDFRSYEEAQFDFTTPLTVLCGPNGSGKSNCLEAIGFLSLLRSFRNARVRDMVRLGRSSFQISGMLEKEYLETLSVTMRGESRTLQIGDRTLSRASEFIREFRTVAFSPEDLALTRGSASARRMFFDRLISVKDGEYFRSLQHYHHALSSLNAILKKGESTAHDSVCQVFETILAKEGALLERKRDKAVLQIAREAGSLLANCGMKELTIRKSSDFTPEEEANRRLLEENRKRNFFKGVCVCGSHLNEYVLDYDGRNLRICGSTGQHRMISLFLKMAELKVLRGEKERSPVPVLALVDDVTTELDRENRKRFLDNLRNYADQAVFTFTAVPKDLPDARVIRLDGPSR